jgi:hypothetical protein
MVLRISKDILLHMPKIPMIKKHKCVFIKFKIIKLIELKKFVDVFLFLTAKSVKNIILHNKNFKFLLIIVKNFPLLRQFLSISVMNNPPIKLLLYMSKSMSYLPFYLTIINNVLTDAY